MSPQMLYGTILGPTVALLLTIVRQVVPDVINLECELVGEPAVRISHYLLLYMWVVNYEVYKKGFLQSVFLSGVLEYVELLTHCSMVWQSISHY